VTQPICPPCQEESLRWLDTKPSQMFPEFGFTYGSGAAYDAGVAGIRDGWRGRHEKWRQLVRHQQALIARHCRTAGHTPPPTVPAVVQLDLFELIGGRHA
jgi:hypothetical protein